MTVARRIGLLGGTFDPVHVAHLHIAGCAMHDLSLDEIRFTPAGSPPHKPGVPVTPGSHRIHMLEIATAGVDGFLVDPLDLGSDQPSYTSELLEHVHEDHPYDDLWFIIGADSLAEFHTWHEPGRILELARLAVATRPGWDVDVALAASPVPGLRDRVDLFSSVPVDLSATVIRHRLRNGQPVDWLMPKGVLTYIGAQDLYRTEAPEAP